MGDGSRAVSILAARYLLSDRLLPILEVRLGAFSPAVGGGTGQEEGCGAGRTVRSAALARKQNPGRLGSEHRVFPSGPTA